MNIGEDEDVKVLDHGVVNNLKFALLLYAHAHHDFIPADNPRRLALGYACIDCDECWEMHIGRAKQSTGHKSIDDLITAICTFSINRTQEGLLPLLELHEEASLKLKRLACMM